MKTMRPLLHIIALAVILAVPLGLHAQATDSVPQPQLASGAEQSGPTVAANSPSATGESFPGAPQKDSVAPDMGIEQTEEPALNVDYGKNPYWEPRDWDYINANGSGGE
jgi:hypothetical protein